MMDVFREGFPDLHLEVRDTAADERMVALRIQFTGTHTGPSADRRLRFSGLEINLMADGTVAEHWFQPDSVTLFEQLGLRVVPGTVDAAAAGRDGVTRMLAEGVAWSPNFAARRNSNPPAHG